MAADRTLLELESRLTKNMQNNAIPATPLFRVPSSATIPKEDRTAELQEFADTLMSGSADKNKLDELSSKLKGYVTVIPEPGLCIKMKNSDARKIFVNLCTSEKVPALDGNLTEADLAEKLQSSAESMRIPMSIGEPHNEVDHSGEPCSVYDIVVHPLLFQKIEKSELFYHFFISVAMEALEEKFGLKIDRKSAVTLKGKKFFGKILEQRVRTKPKLVEEIQKPVSAVLSPGAPEAAVSKYVSPSFELWVDPQECKDRYLFAEIVLSGVNDLKQLSLAVGDDRILLTSSNVKPKNYRLDISLPVHVVPDQVAASFKHSTKMLAVSLPVA